MSVAKRKKSMMTMLVLVPLVLALCFGCSAAEQNTNSQVGNESTSHEEGTGGLYDEIKRIEDWKEVYPEIYESYMSGADVIKDYEPSKNGEDTEAVTVRSHSHAVMAETFFVSAQQYSPRGPYRTSCLQCHSTEQHRYFDEYGDDAFNMQLGGWDYFYEDLRTTGREIEFWGCYQCHENDPENITRATNIMWNNGKMQSYDFADNDAVCGQCHSIPVTDNVNDLYRYGIDADSIGKALLEDYGFLMSVCTDVEIFQNSTHQKQGMTCTSCHMPSVTDENGTIFTSHDASGSPLEKEASMEYCLTCHESQGIESAADMITFVKDKQNDVATDQGKLREDLAKLDEAITAMEASKEAGTAVDETLLADLKDASMWAEYYLGFTTGGSSIDGTLATHNYEGMKTLLSKGSTLVADALAKL